MTDPIFADYAALAKGGEFDIVGKVDAGSYFADLGLMLNVARGSRRLRFGAKSKFAVYGGITLEDDINGTAEKYRGKHFCSVTIGHCFANLYCAETLLGSGALPDLGQARTLAVPGSALTLKVENFDDYAQIFDEILIRRSHDPQRLAVSKYISHVMFLFVFYHEFFHGCLGHCGELEERSLKPKLREFGQDCAATTPLAELIRGFEVSADSLAADAVMISILGKLDLPTRLELFDADEFSRNRLALLAMALVVILWHQLDGGKGDSFHPSPLKRLFNILDCVFNGSAERADGAKAKALLDALITDLKGASNDFEEIDGSMKDFAAMTAAEAFAEIAGLRKTVSDAAPRRYFPRN